jgi:hypothetical protein
MAPVASPPIFASALDPVVSKLIPGQIDRKTYEVCVSLEPLHMMTSAGLVFVRKFFLYTSSPFVTFLNKDEAVLIIPPISLRA